MIEIKTLEIAGFKSAVMGMRNSYKSRGKSDSFQGIFKNEPVFMVGPNDFDLMKKLSKAGRSHAKFRRMIVVYADITAPLYWWKEFDTYKVGTVANSESTMHSIAEKEFSESDFSTEHLINTGKDLMSDEIIALNICRQAYLDYDDLDEKRKAGMCEEGIRSKKDIWWQMIQLLPSSYNQMRTVMMNYEVLSSIYQQRKGHRLDEWKAFLDWIEDLPYSEVITGNES